MPLFAKRSTTLDASTHSSEQSGGSPGSSSVSFQTPNSEPNVGQLHIEVTGDMEEDSDQLNPPIRKRRNTLATMPSVLSPAGSQGRPSATPSPVSEEVAKLSRSSSVRSTHIHTVSDPDVLAESPWEEEDAASDDERDASTPQLRRYSLPFESFASVSTGALHHCVL